MKSGFLAHVGQAECTVGIAVADFLMRLIHKSTIESNSSYREDPK